MSSVDSIALPAISRRPRSMRSRAEVAFLLGEQQSAERITRRLFGRVLHSTEYAGLAGAPDDAKVEVGASDGKLYFEMSDSAAAYRAHFFLYRKNSDIVLLNDGLHIHVRAMQHRGLGLRMFLRQAHSTAALGIDRIETVAGRRHDENGYYTWPRFGFDGILPESIRRRLPMGVKHSITVLDLMECEKGRSWWREHGATIRVAFDLAPGSRSRKVLMRYVRIKTASLAQKEILKMEI